ncbi:MAG: hypothetical protein RL429_834 [Bacteroidota bacterium]
MYPEALMKHALFGAAMTLTVAVALAQAAKPNPREFNPATLTYAGEKHLKNVRQLTFGADNAEAYWSFDSKSLVFQSNNPEWGAKCDQIYWYKDVGQVEAKPRMLSTGMGRTTCAYVMPGDQEVLYASTHLGGADCPPEPERRHGRYVWPIYPTFDVFTADLEGRITRQLTHEPGYDAEATVSPKGDRIVFTSDRSGDLELYTMKLDGSDVRQVTFALGYDGGAFFSPDGEWLVWRASRPRTPEAMAKYASLLAEHLVEPTEMELYVARADGSQMRQVTQLGNANWAPFFTPDGTRILFSSNHASPLGFPFNLYMVNLDGTGLEQVTYDTAFDSFPMFSPDGKRLVWGSNRNNGGTRATNLFVADWVD